MDLVTSLVPSYTVQRQREGDMDDDGDDDMSLVSRSPSPVPQNDPMDVDQYDEYVRGAPREVITVDTKIKPTNKGFALLAKLGWVEGHGVGLSGDGKQYAHKVDGVSDVLFKAELIPSHFKSSRT